MRLARNFAIIAVLAALVAFAPAGGTVMSTALVALTMCFLGVIAWAIWTFASRNEFTFDAMTDRDRLLIYGAAGMVALLLTGTSRFFASGLGTVAWIVLLVGSVMIAWRTWQSANAY